MGEGSRLLCSGIHQSRLDLCLGMLHKQRAIGRGLRLGEALVTGREFIAVVMATFVGDVSTARKDLRKNSNNNNSFVTQPNA